MLILKDPSNPRAIIMKALRVPSAITNLLEKSYLCYVNPYDVFYGFTRTSIDCNKFRYFQNSQIIQIVSPIPYNLIPTGLF